MTEPSCLEKSQGCSSLGLVLSMAGLILTAASCGYFFFRQGSGLSGKQEEDFTKAGIFFGAGVLCFFVLSNRLHNYAQKPCNKRQSLLDAAPAPAPAPAGV